MAGSPWTRYQQGAQAGPVIAPPDPYKQANEQRAQEDQARDAERLRIAQGAEARAATEAAQGSESERTAGFLAGRVVDGVGRLTSAISADRSSAGPSLGVEAVRGIAGDTAANYITDADRQQVIAAQLDIVDAALTLGTGAAYTPEQLENYRKVYFPKLGDDPATIASKREALRSLLVAAQTKAGRAAPDIERALADLDALGEGDAGAAAGAMVGGALADTQMSGRLEELIRAGAPLEAINTELQAKNFSPVDAAAYASMRQFLEQNPDYDGPIAQALRLKAADGPSEEPPPTGGGGGSALPRGLQAASDSFGQAFIGVPQGVAQAYDFGTTLATLPLQAGFQGLTRGGNALLGAAGFPNAGNFLGEMGRGQQAVQNHMTNAAGVIENAAPTPPGFEGARFAGQLAGGLMIPGPKLVPRAAAAEAAPVNALARAGGRTRATAGEARALQADTGVPIMTSDVRPPRTRVGQTLRTVGENIPFIGTGGTRAGQQEARVNAAREVLQDFGGLTDNAAIDAVSADLSAQRSAALTRWTGVKRAITERLPGTVPVTRAVAAIDGQIARLRSIGTDAANSVIPKLENWKQALQNQGIDNIEEIRREMGRAFTASDMTHAREVGEKAVSALYNPLREDIAAFVGNTAGPEAAAEWAKANRVLSGMAGEMKMSRLRRVLQSGDTTPEDVGNLLFSSKPSEVRALYNGLSEAGQANARAAIMQRVFRDLGDEIDVISPEKFLSAMRRVTTPAGIVFRGADDLRVKGVVRALQLTRRAAGAAADPATGNRNVPFFLGLIASTGAGAAILGTIGAGARIYESAPVRDLLLRMARSRPGSPQESATFSRLQAVLARMTPAAGSMTGSAANDVLAQSPGRLAAAEQEQN